MIEESAGVFEVDFEDVQGQEECVLCVRPTRRQLCEDLVADGEEVALPKKLKSQLRKANQEQEVFAAAVSEVYREPRVTKEASNQGLAVGGAYDLKTGYDLREAKDLARMEKELKADAPELICCSSPCTPFSILQAWKYPRMPEEKVRMMIAEGLEHMKIVAAWCWYQIQKGRLFLVEHPRGSKMWSEEEMQELMALPGVMICDIDQCAYGLRVGEELNKKPTRWITNSLEIAAELQRRCAGDHVHEKLLGGKAAKAAEYPKQGHCTRFEEAPAFGVP